MEWWCGRLGLTVGVRHGDTTQGERRKQTLSPPDLLVTTPGDTPGNLHGAQDTGTSATGQICYP